ncbi:hypothetical protein BH11PLA1_BH11PLA1_01020 [soil metagenome]
MSRKFLGITLPNSPESPEERFGSALGLASILSSVLAGAVVLLVAPHFPYVLGRAKFDQDVFHVPTIQKFAAELPVPDLSDYASATTPGFHLGLAVISRIAPGDTFFHLATAVIGTSVLVVLGCRVALACGLAVAVHGGARRSTQLTHVLAAIAPLACSSYFVQSSLYVLPDNAAWWSVCAVLILALMLAAPVDKGEGMRRPLVAGGVALVILVFTRQIHIWAAAPLWVAAVIWAASMPAAAASHRASGSRFINAVLPPRKAAASDSEFPRFGDLIAGVRSRALAVAVICTLPAFGLLYAFYRLWGGLTPPRFQAALNPAAVAGSVDATAVTGLSPATPAFVLALFGVLGVFFIPYALVALPNRVRTAPRRGVREHLLALPGAYSAIGVGAAVAAVLAGVPPTTWSSPVRKGGLWNIAQRFEGTPGFDTIGGVHLPRLVISDHTNLVIFALAIIGGGVLGLWWRALEPRAKWVLFAALIAFTAANSAQALSWQRYVEPFVLVWCIIAVSARRPEPARDVFDSHLGVMPCRANDSLWLALGPFALALLLAAVTISQFTPA